MGSTSLRRLCERLDGPAADRIAALLLGELTEITASGRVVGAVGEGLAAMSRRNKSGLLVTARKAVERMGDFLNASFNPDDAAVVAQAAANLGVAVEGQESPLAQKACRKLARMAVSIRSKEVGIHGWRLGEMLGEACAIIGPSTRKYADEAAKHATALFAQETNPNDRGLLLTFLEGIVRRLSAEGAKATRSAMMETYFATGRPKGLWDGRLSPEDAKAFSTRAIAALSKPVEPLDTLANVAGWAADHGESFDGPTLEKFVEALLALAERHPGWSEPLLAAVGRLKPRLPSVRVAHHAGSALDALPKAMKATSMEVWGEAIRRLRLFLDDVVPAKAEPVADLLADSLAVRGSSDLILPTLDVLVPLLAKVPAPRAARIASKAAETLASGLDPEMGPLHTGGIAESLDLLAAHLPQDRLFGLRQKAADLLKKSLRDPGFESAGPLVRAALREVDPIV